MMRLFALLVFISMTNLVTCAALWDEIIFPAIVLKPDLEAIEKYYKKFDKSIPAFIHWPNDIFVHVTSEEIDDEDYLRIDGKFKTAKKLRPSSYDCMYYKDGKFYSFSEKKGDIKPLASTVELQYSETYHYRPELGGSYIMIRYESFNEVKKSIQTFQADHIEFLKRYSENSPSTYLAFWTGCLADHFLEYTSWSQRAPAAEGGLLTLIAKEGEAKVSVSSNDRHSRLVFDQNTQKVVILDDPNSPPLEKRVFGVRMETVGFLTEVQGSKIKMLGDDDIAYGAEDESPIKHTVYATDLLKKAKNVEPKTCPSNDQVCVNLRPKRTQFQMHGHVLIKRVNYENDFSEKINEGCPFVIEYPESGVIFMFGDTVTNDICTDDKHVWVSHNKNADNTQNEFVTILYSQGTV